MEERSIIQLKNKTNLTITGVNKIHGFNSTTFDVDTILGDLHIEGKNLAMDKLDNETKELYISGEINKLCYQEVKKNKESFLKKLIK